MTDEEERELYKLLSRLNKERFDAAKVCERCQNRPPATIMNFSSYVAVCDQCANELHKGLEEHRRELANLE